MRDASHPHNMHPAYPLSASRRWYHTSAPRRTLTGHQVVELAVRQILPHLVSPIVGEIKLAPWQPVKAHGVANAYGWSGRGKGWGRMPEWLGVAGARAGRAGLVIGGKADASPRKGKAHQSANAWGGAKKGVGEAAAYSPGGGSVLCQPKADCRCSSLDTLIPRAMSRLADSLSPTEWVRASCFQHGPMRQCAAKEWQHKAPQC